ncbi:MAG: hypothetical protein KDD02_19710 [Phaeodactylibacter sp.]|nr:hypothetical protein [Phaeodactylibacter sp.]
MSNHSSFSMVTKLKSEVLQKAELEFGGTKGEVLWKAELEFGLTLACCVNSWNFPTFKSSKT